MSQVVNLNQYRKQRRRAEAQRQAVENRARFGRSKVDRSTGVAERERHARDLDGKRLDQTNSEDSR
jgi:hypothetical protein